MDLSLSDEALHFQASVRNAMSTFRASMLRFDHLHDDATRARAHEALGGLGTWELDVAGSLVEATAAALAAEEAGRVAVPVSVAALLTAQAAGVDGVVHAVARCRPGAQVLVDHVDTTGPIRLVDLDGAVSTATAMSGRRPTRLLAPAAGWVEAGPKRSGDPQLWALHECFSAFASLGALEAALDHTRDHLQERQQFNKPLAAFQALQHRFADALREVHGLRELTLYTFWRVHSRRGVPISDALALRVKHLEALREVFRHAHQMHGALGFCYEHPLAVLSTSVQFRRYAPLTAPATLSRLAGRLADLDMLFADEHPSAAART